MEKHSGHQLSFLKKNVNLRSEENGEPKYETKFLKKRQCSSGSNTDYKSKKLKVSWTKVIASKREKEKRGRKLYNLFELEGYGENGIRRPLVLQYSGKA